MPTFGPPIASSPPTLLSRPPLRPLSYLTCSPSPSRPPSAALAISPPRALTMTRGGRRQHPHRPTVSANVGGQRSYPAAPKHLLLPMDATHAVHDVVLRVADACLNTFLSSIATDAYLVLLSSSSAMSSTDRRCPVAAA